MHSIFIVVPPSCAVSNFVTEHSCGRVVGVDYLRHDHDAVWNRLTIRVEHGTAAFTFRSAASRPSADPGALLDGSALRHEANLEREGIVLACRMPLHPTEA